MKPADCPVTDCPAVPVVSSDAPARSLAHLLWGAAGFASFARSSERLDAWFKGTALYKKVLVGYVTKRAMTVKAKLAVVVPASAVMAVGFALMGAVPAMRVVLAVVWVAHIVCFGFVVKTERAQ